MKISWSRKWQPTQVSLPEKFHGQKILAGYSSIGLQRAGHNWAHTHSFTCLYIVHGCFPAIAKSKCLNRNHIIHKLYLLSDPSEKKFAYPWPRTSRKLPEAHIPSHKWKYVLFPIPYTKSNFALAQKLSIKISLFFILKCLPWFFRLSIKQHPYFSPCFLPWREPTILIILFNPFYSSLAPVPNRFLPSTPCSENLFSICLHLSLESILNELESKHIFHHHHLIVLFQKYLVIVDMSNKAAWDTPFVSPLQSTTRKTTITQQMFLCPTYKEGSTCLHIWKWMD